MRITCVLPPPDLSGGFRVVAEYADRLEHRGHCVQALSVKPGRLSMRERLRSFRRIERIAELRLLSSLLRFPVQLQSNIVASTTIADFIIANGRINFAVVSFQDRFIPVPFNLTQVNFQQQNISINISQQQLRQAPSFTKGQFPNTLPNAEFMTRVNNFFGTRAPTYGSEVRPETRPPVTRPQENRPPEVRPPSNRPPETRPMEKRPQETRPMEKRPPVKPPVEKKPPVKPPEKKQSSEDGSRQEQAPPDKR